MANLLDLSRLEAGALVARLDWCAPEEIVAGALEAAEPVLEGMPVAVRIDPRPAAGARRRRSCASASWSTCSTTPSATAAPPVVDRGPPGAATGWSSRVTDAGPGPDPAVAARLFDPFAAGPRTGGTGVGLALARGLAEAQGALLEPSWRGPARPSSSRSPWSRSPR